VLATVGHELRTPLTSIRGYIETVLESDVDPATARRFLETARREALRLGRLVDGMLEASIVTSSKSCATCNVVEQIRATVDLVAPMAAARRVTIRTHLPQVARARVDEDACVHALANLVENAVKHGNEPGTIEVSCHRGRQFIAIVIEDDGRGILPEERETIFAMGVRGDASARPGSGIGLAVVKAIAARAGGDVRAEPAALGGARFVLRFPAA
jgi:two-component system phosphate regulon sensor histidine kinase PhoR